LKLLLIAFGGLNALYFEFVIARRPEVLENRTPLPRSVRNAGLASIAIWTLVIVCGRLLAYIPH
jgi:predicted outer membrane lipoprotein